MLLPPLDPVAGVPVCVHVVARARTLLPLSLAPPHLPPLAPAPPLCCRYDTRKDLTFAPDAPVIGLVLQRSHLVTGDHGHYDGVVGELEARGAKVVPVFAGGLDFSSPVKKFFYDPLGSGKSFVNTVVSLTGFALVGGPARQDAPKAVEALKQVGGGCRVGVRGGAVCVCVGGGGGGCARWALGE